MEEIDMDRIIRNLSSFDKWKISVNAKIGEMWFKLDLNDPRRITIEKISRLLDLAVSPKQCYLEPVFSELRKIGMESLIPNNDIINEWNKGNY